MKIKVTQSFQYHGTEHKKGKTVDLPDSVAESTIEKGYGEKVEEEGSKTPELDIPEEPEEHTEGKPESVFGEMEKKLDEEPENPPTWSPPRKDAPDPEEVDDLKGRVQRVSRNVGKNENDVIAVKTTDGESLSLWKKAALKDLFNVVEVEDYIAVRYTGTETGSSGRTYLTYRYLLYDKDKNLKVSG